MLKAEKADKYLGEFDMKYVMLGAAILFLSACGKVNMNIENLDSIDGSTSPVFNNIATSEFVSASNSPLALTSGGYKVTASAGYITEKNKETTTANNYKVYFGVNGQIVSAQ